MSKIKIVDAEYSDETSNNRITEVVASYGGFRRGITKNNYPKFIEQVYKRTQFFFNYHYEKKDSTSARLDLIERNIYGMDEVPLCAMCEESPIMPLREGGLSSCCSKSCAAKLSCKKSEETNIKKRGVRHHSQDAAVREKTKNTLASRYDGAICPLDVPEFAEKVRKTNLERRGVEHHMKIESIVASITEKNRENPNSPLNPLYHEKRRESDSSNGKSQYIQDEYAWGVLNSKQALETMLLSMSFNDAAIKLGVDKKTISNYANLHGLEIDRYRFGNRSSAEIQVEEFIKSFYDKEVVSGYRGISRCNEIDIYLPEDNIGFEFNGLYWHSKNPLTLEKFNKNKHLMKTEAAKDSGIRLIHIFEDEWIHRKEQVKSKIKAILGVRSKAVHGRKTITREVSPKEAKNFFNEHHIQGACRAFFYGGLYYEDSLVAVMAFSKTRSGTELSRFATSCKVHGGFSKLLKFFKEQHQDVARVVSFADRRWSEGGVYEKNGFELDSVLRPDYRYVVGDMRVHKSNYRKDRMAKLLEDYNPSLSESQNAWNHGLYQIWDCGLMKFVKDL